MAPRGEQEAEESVMDAAAMIWIRKDRQALRNREEGWSDTAAFPVLAGAPKQLEESSTRKRKAPRMRGFFCVPSMFDSLEVRVLYPT